MTDTPPVITLSPRDYDAVLFDLDGVLTRTARVHAAAWKELFDAFLAQRSAETGQPFVPFDSDADYRLHVDGKPRQDGVTAFLESRGIDVPQGAPDDGSDARTVYGLGTLKDQYFLRRLKQDGVEPYEAAIVLVRTLRAHAIKTAVVSSSNNCAAVLEAAGLADLFDARVDGLDITRLALSGKPAPDAFLEAARRLEVEPSRAVVVEDAVAGVEAGRAGGFGSVIGVDRGGRSLALREAGAGLVVTSLAQVRVAAESPSAWSLVFDGFDPAKEGIREALCTLGNGYFATRAAAPGAVANGVHYPGTYLAGGYNRLHTDVAGPVVENEDLVNLPNWLALQFRIADADWFDARTVTILAYRQELDLRHGLLLRTMRFEDGAGRRSTLVERRLVSMADMHLGALELSLTAENWSAAVAIRTAIDGRVPHDSTRRTRTRKRRPHDSTRRTCTRKRRPHDSIRRTRTRKRRPHDSARQTNDSARQTNDSARQTNDNSRRTNDSTRLTNDNARLTNGNARLTNDNARLTNDNSRRTNDNSRLTNDSTRLTNDSTRRTNHSTRLTNDSTRLTNDNARLTNHSTPKYQHLAPVGTSAPRPARHHWRRDTLYGGYHYAVASSSHAQLPALGR